MTSPDLKDYLPWTPPTGLPLAVRIARSVIAFLIGVGLVTLIVLVTGGRG